MLTLVAILAGPILVTTIVTIFVSEIKDAWGRNRPEVERPHQLCRSISASAGASLRVKRDALSLGGGNWGRIVGDNATVRGCHKSRPLGPKSPVPIRMACFEIPLAQTVRRAVVKPCRESRLPRKNQKTSRRARMKPGKSSRSTPTICAKSSRSYTSLPINGCISRGIGPRKVA
jgi:hypothetical protein